MNRSELTTRIFREVGIVQERADFFLRRDLPPDLPAVQFKLLSHLLYTTNRDETPSALAKNSLVSLSAMSLVIKQLVAKGYVELEPQKDDARQKIVRMTEAGRAAHGRALAGIADDFRPVAAVLPARELEELLKLLRAFREAYERSTASLTSRPEAMP